MWVLISFVFFNVSKVIYSIIKMKRNRSLNKTNGLLAKMKSSYVTTCFGLHLWPSSGYYLVASRVLYIMLIDRVMMRSHSSENYNLA
jgi:hypothetical protein